MSVQENEPHCIQKQIHEESYAEELQNVEIYGDSPVATADQIIELFMSCSPINHVTNFLKCNITNNNSYSVKLKIPVDFTEDISHKIPVNFTEDISHIYMRNSYIVTKDEATKILFWIINHWLNSTLNVIKETKNSNIILLNDSGIYKFHEWLTVLDNYDNESNNQNFEDSEDDDFEDEDYIKSTLKMVKDSISNNIIEKWISSDIYSYSKELCVSAGEPQLYELSIDNNTENLSDMSFNWTHHTITEQTLYNLLKWILYKWIIKYQEK